jgi:hypothetical protein
LSSASDYAPNTNQLLTNYSFITHSLALSLALILTKLSRQFLSPQIQKHITLRRERAFGFRR